MEESEIAKSTRLVVKLLPLRILKKTINKPFDSISKPFQKTKQVIIPDKLLSDSFNFFLEVRYLL